MSKEKVTKLQAIGGMVLGLVLGPVIIYFMLNAEMPKEENLQEITITVAQQEWERTPGKKRRSSKSFVIHDLDDNRYSVNSYVELNITHDGRKPDGYEPLLKLGEPASLWVEPNKSTIWQLKQGETMLLRFEDAVKDKRGNNQMGLYVGAGFTIVGLICLGLLLFAPATYWEP